MDPLAEEMSSYSSYNYVLDNPISYLDPLGLAPYSYNWDTEQYENKDGEVVSWGTVKSYLDQGDGGSQRSNVDIALVPEGNNHEYVQDYNAFKNGSNIQTFKVKNITDAISQLTDFLGDDKAIGNLFLLSHGARNEAWFQIGSTQYYTPEGTANATNLSKLGALFGKNGQVIIMSCHFGSAINGGTEMAKAVAANLGVAVYASRSWTASSKEFGGIYLDGWIKTPYTLTARDTNVPYNTDRFSRYAHDHVGEWIRVSPNGYIQPITNMRIHRGGSVRYSASIPAIRN